MNLIKDTWSWLSISKNQKTLTVVCVGLSAAVGGMWQVYVHFFDHPTKSTPTVSASGQGMAVGRNIIANGEGIVTTGDVTKNITNNFNGITLERYEAGLKRREQEVRNELVQVNALDKEKIALLEKQLTDVQARLQNPEAALAEHKQKLAEAYQAFHELKQEVLPEQIKLAQASLTKGETGEAEKLFKQVVDKGKDNAAEVAYQLAELAKDRIDYATAGKYYQKATNLQPDNSLYLNAASLMAYTQGEHAKAEPLNQRSLAIREKELDHDHPNTNTVPFQISADTNFTTPIDVSVDTGSHTCTSLGQEMKVYSEVYAGDGRYFVNSILAVMYKFGAGNCEFNSDGGAPAIQTGQFKFTDADGQVEIMEKPIRYIVRAFADCTNNPGNLGSRISTECRFTATSKIGTQ
ncbi:MAG: tetratricopeptide repeat protein [Methyloglobulus sp.]